VKAFGFDATLTEAFVRLGDELCRGDAGRLPPDEAALRAQLHPSFPFYGRPGADHCRFLAFARGRPVARAIASVHPELGDRDGTPVGAIGFFETVRDYAAAGEVLGAAVEWLAARGRRRVWGPLQFDIWHGYRFMTRGFERERFLGEPCNEPWYPEHFERFGFAPRRRWNSFDLGGTQGLERLAAPWADDHRRLLERGYRFETMNGEPLEATLERLHGVLSDSFSGFLGFTPLSLPEFLEVVGAARHAIERRCSSFVYDETGRLAGFATVFRDLAAAVRATQGRSGWPARARFWLAQRRAGRLMLHLGGITRAEASRHTGLAGALFRETLLRVGRSGYRELLGTLVARGNPVRRYYGEYAADTSREYTLYELRT